MMGIYLTYSLLRKGKADEPRFLEVTKLKLKNELNKSVFSLFFFLTQIH